MSSRSSAPWVVGGFLIQAAAAAAAGWIVYRNVKREGIIGQITTYTVRLAWHDSLHQPRLVAVLVGLLVLYAAGATVQAWPYARQRYQLMWLVPIAAVLSTLVLGVLALFIALLFLGDAFDLDIPGFGGGRGRAGTDRRVEDQPVDDVHG